MNEPRSEAELNDETLSPFVEDVLDHISPRAIDRARVITAVHNKAVIERQKRIVAAREIIIQCRLAERGDLGPILE